jgi:hypothetical protein
MNTRLEYSELLGKFNQANLTNETDHLNGYKTICCLIELERADRFIAHMNVKYPQLNNDKPYPIPTFKEIKSEIFQFIKRDIQFLEEEMDKRFRRRSKLFN